MKRHLFILALTALLAAGPLMAGPIDLGADPARSIVSQSAGQDTVPDNDPRLAQARTWLKKASQATGEGEDFVAAASVKLARYLFDTARVRATALETLEGLATYAPSGKPMGETTNAYFQARRTAPNKTHAEAMAALAARK
ncbi:MAG: hypothetical protein HY778_05840 [Betaproteobacteria bacterium]|nr:hypothetical protein [Betaproteobacteria bacterium]